MTSEPRSNRVRYFDRTPCGEYHNPGHWPYLAACVLAAKHKGVHQDKDGKTWPRSKDALR